MKKFLPLVLVLLVLVGVGFYIREKQKTTQTLEKQGNDALLPQTIVPVTEKGGVISSIKDAMGLGQKMKCTYTETDDNGVSTSSTIVVDGQKYKFTGDENGETVYGIFDGDTQYMWLTGAAKQGWKMTRTCVDELTKGAPTLAGDGRVATETPQDFEKSFGAAQGVKCEPSNEDFSVPADVNFVDQCEMMKNSLTE